MRSSAPKLLMLGASDTQQIAIERAKARGLYVITADNRPDNPGHRLADESHNVSTTDAEGVLALAKAVGVDGVISYASDPGALTAAYVAHHLGLPGDPLAAVKKAQDKFLLRSEQTKLGHRVPPFALSDDLDGLKHLWASTRSGLVVKPTDRAGSVGLCLFRTHPSWPELMAAVAQAKDLSFQGRAIVEARLETQGLQFGGDYVVSEGRVVFAAHTDQYLFQTATTQTALGSLNPSGHDAAVLASATHQVEQLVGQLGLRFGIYNIDACLVDGEVVILDFGARLGGNWLGEVHRHATGVNFTDLAIQLAIGEALPPLPNAGAGQPMNAGTLGVHADRAGRFKSLSFSEALNAVIVKQTLSVREGQPVFPFRGTPDRLGLLLMASPDREALVQLYASPQAHFGLTLDPPAP